MPPPACWLALLPALLLAAPPALAEEPLHVRIDQLIAARAVGRPVSAPADDAEFLRRVTLDLAGRIPSAQEARAFLADKAPDRRARLIDRLLAGDDYPRRMQELFHAMLMERLGDHPEWTAYLRRSFAANKPWDQLTREMLRAAPRDEATRGAAFFLAKRLDHYGQNPIDYPALTRDVGRLFLGKDFRCAQCHDHLFIHDYKQQDFQGLFAFFQNAFLQDLTYPTVGEKPTTQKIAFMSVFEKVKRETGPRLPGGPEVAIPTLSKKEQFLQPPNPKTRFPGVPRFSPLERLAEQVATADNPDFTRNIANRLWWVMMGRGLVHPLDLHHAGNPPAHPELLDLLARAFAAHRFDVKWMLRELALSQTYQRSSLLPEGGTPAPPSRFLTALEKRLSAEQMMWSVLEATGEKDRLLQAEARKPAAPVKGKIPPSPVEAVRARFVKAFANPPREPEEEVSFSLRAALFVLNDDTVLGWLAPRPGNLVDRLAKRSDEAAAEEVYLAVLTRRPTAEERAEAIGHLHKNAARRPAALGQLAWSLLASTEFCVNH